MLCNLIILYNLLLYSVQKASINSQKFSVVLSCYIIDKKMPMELFLFILPAYEVKILLD